jgi:N-terminal half of MaoC dehydratase
LANAETAGSVLAVNTAIEGKVYPEARFEVEAEHVADFAASIWQSVSGVPPTFLTVAEFGVFGPIMDDPELDLDFPRVVHSDQEYVWHRPLVVGETLIVGSRIASIRERGGHGFLTIEVSLSSEDGEPVATTLATLLERGSG